MTEPKAPRKMHPLRRALMIVFLILSVPVIVAFGFYGVAPFKVPSESMLPILEPGDFIFALPQDTYARGDIVVLRSPVDEGYFVKRVVGVGGDTIEILGGALFINGEYASEPYTKDAIQYSLTKLEVPDGELLVLGDNRNESADASMWVIDANTGEGRLLENHLQAGEIEGEWKRTIPVKSIIGKVVFRYLPFGRWGEIRSFPLTNVSGQ